MFDARRFMPQANGNQALFLRSLSRWLSSDCVLSPAKHWGVPGQRHPRLPPSSSLRAGGGKGTCSLDQGRHQRRGWWALLAVGNRRRASLGGGGGPVTAGEGVSPPGRTRNMGRGNWVQGAAPTLGCWARSRGLHTIRTVWLPCGGAARWAEAGAPLRSPQAAEGPTLRARGKP